MKFQHHLIVVVALGGFFLNTNPIFGQGSLTPPGAPAPTMKSADQIEPRTIVNAANTPGDSQNSFIITNSGSYYLTTNLVGVSGKNGIEIFANNVTLDLNGFSLLGVAGSQSGIFITYFGNYCTNITVRNGSLSGWGANGLQDNFIQQSGYNEAANPNLTSWQNHIFENLNATANGGSGIQAVHGTVRNCQATGNNGYGIWVVSATITGCLVQRNVFAGIEANGADCKISGNNCIGNNSSANNNYAGINVEIAASNCRIEDNSVLANGYAGIRLTGGDVTNNIVVRNHAASNNGPNYLLSSGNLLGPILNNSTGAITNSSPWGNFSF